WYLNGRKPLEVTAVTDGQPDLEVDEHCIAIARYAFGLSKFETRWGTFTDPWTHQPQPKCGFVLKGRDGNISSYDYENSIRAQPRVCVSRTDSPDDVQAPPFQSPVRYVVHRLENALPSEGTLKLETGRIRQQIVDTAAASTRENRTLPL